MLDRATLDQLVADAGFRFGDPLALELIELLRGDELEDEPATGDDLSEDEDVQVGGADGPGAGDLPGGDLIEIEVVVIDAKKLQAGFYLNALRTFYVSSDNRVYIVREPGTAAVLRAVDALPNDATFAGTEPETEIIYHLATAAELAAGRVGG